MNSLSRQPRRRMAPAEYALALYIVSAYVFSADAERIWVSNLAGLAVVALSALTAVERNSMAVNMVVASRVAFAILCAFTAAGGPGWDVVILTAARIAILIWAVVIVTSAVGSIRAVELGCYIGTAVLLLNACYENAFFHAPPRYGNLVVNANAYAFVLLVSSIFAARRLFFSARAVAFPARCALIIVLLASAQQIAVASGSRKGLLSLVLLCGLMIAGTWRLRSSRQAVRLMLVMVPVAAVILVLVFITPYWARVEAVFDMASGGDTNEPSASTRLAMAKEAWNLWLARPLLGWGLDQFRYLGSWGTYSHSTLMELLADCGLVGAVLYYAAYFSVIAGVWRRWRFTVVLQSRLDLFWVATTVVLLVIWGLGSVQLTDKLDAALLAAVSTVPDAAGRQVAASREALAARPVCRVHSAVLK